MHRLAVTISQFCAERSIRLEMQWFPQTESEKTDYISHLVDFDDWQITHDFFLSLEELWGPHTPDSFRISASGMDFFAQDLGSKNCLMVFQVPLVARDVHYLSIQKATATLVVPSVPTSSFLPLLTSKYR